MHGQRNFVLKYLQSPKLFGKIKNSSFYIASKILKKTLAVTILYKIIPINYLELLYIYFNNLP